MGIQVIYSRGISGEGDQNLKFLYTKLLSSIEDHSCVYGSSSHYLPYGVTEYDEICTQCQAV